MRQLAARLEITRAHPRLSGGPSGGHRYLNVVLALAYRRGVSGAWVSVEKTAMSALQQSIQDD